MRGTAGVYAIINNITGAIYIGSSIDIRIRLVQHLVTNNTNDYLQNALKKYRLENFTFAVVEFCDSQVLLQREQYYIDILFSLFFFFCILYCLFTINNTIYKKRKTLVVCD